jgi:hypothetical protein
VLSAPNAHSLFDYSHQRLYTRPLRELLLHSNAHQDLLLNPDSTFPFVSALQAM